jgi:putative hydrolase of the HAD superfamily
VVSLQWLMESGTGPFFTSFPGNVKQLMHNCRFNAALLDFGGVVAEEGFAAGVKAIARAAGRDQDEVWRVGLEAVWDSGYVYGRCQEGDFWKLFKARTGIEGDEKRWRDEILSLFVVRPWMRRFADRLRELGVVTAILSDQTDWLRLLDERQSFSQHFDKIFNSFDHDMTKQEPAFFSLALRELKLEPERTLFVDDNPGNVERARDLGMHAVLYKDREGFESDMMRLCPTALTNKD